MNLLGRCGLAALLAFVALLSAQTHASPPKPKQTASTRRPPAKADFNFNACQIKVWAGATDDAEQCFREGLKQSPHNALGHIGLAECLIGKGKASAAEMEFQLGITASHTPSLPYRNPATFAGAVGRYINQLAAGKFWIQIKNDCTSLKYEYALNGTCGSLLPSLIETGELDGALALYGTDPNAQNLHKDALLDKLLAAQRYDDAKSVCENDGVLGLSCRSLIKKLFDADKPEQAAGLARAVSAVGSLKSSFGLTFLADQMSFELQPAQRLMLYLEAYKIDLNSFSVSQGIQKLDAEGHLIEAFDGVRKLSPGAKLDPLMFGLGSGSLYRLAYQGYIDAQPKDSAYLYTANCQIRQDETGQSSLLPPGRPVKLAYAGTLKCGQWWQSIDYLAVEYEGGIWGVPSIGFEYKLAPASAPTRPPSSITAGEVIALIGHSGGQPTGPASSPLDEMTLGLNEKKQILSSHSLYIDASAQEVGNRALKMLMDTPIAQQGRVEAFELTVIRDTAPNAFSTAGGHIYVTSGLLSYIGNNVGLWSAVLAHESGHVVAHHQYKKYVRELEIRASQEYLRGRAANGGTANQWAWIISVAGGHLAEKKLDRNDELEADRLGILMLAQAGVHPDFAITLMREMKSGIGEKSKMSTFLFADHPRWDTREKKTKEAYDQALTVFKARYTDPADSPGGSLTTALAELHKGGQATELEASKAETAEVESEKSSSTEALTETNVFPKPVITGNVQSPTVSFAGQSALVSFKVDYVFGSRKLGGTLRVYSGGVALISDRKTKHRGAEEGNTPETFAASCAELKSGLVTSLPKQASKVLPWDREFEIKLRADSEEERWFLASKSSDVKNAILERIQSTCHLDKKLIAQKDR